MAKHKYIETPEKLFELFEEYRTQTKAKPFLVKDWVGKDGFEVKREKEKPLTFEGFKNYCRKVIGEVEQYFINPDNRYSEYISICRTIKDEIRQDQIEGGMAMIYNPSITQRLNGLVDKQETDNKGDITIKVKYEGNTDSTEQTT